MIFFGLYKSINIYGWNCQVGRDVHKSFGKQDVSEKDDRMITRGKNAIAFLFY